MIKAVCLLDHDKPNPEDLKSFCYKYRLGEYLEAVKSIHFRVGGEKYLEAFMQLFPDVVIYDFHEENREDNYRVIMEIIKKMYLKNDYLETSITLATDDVIAAPSEPTEPEADVEPEAEEDVEEELPDLEI
jgi:hypothetical protein